MTLATIYNKVVECLLILFLLMMMKTLFKHRVAHSAKAGIQRGPASALASVVKKFFDVQLFVRESSGGKTETKKGT